jgi:5-methylcytosine-specific restriction endonuclease McrA
MFNPIECAHDSKYCEAKRFVQSDGRIFFLWQCMKCGDRTSAQRGEKRAHEIGIFDTTAVDDFDKSLKHDISMDYYNTVTLKRQKQARDQYDEYLKTPQWEILRQRVLQRCQNVCEGCGVAPAREVHHLTYANIYNELLYQLVGLCSNCHRKAHGHEITHANKLNL